MFDQNYNQNLIAAQLPFQEIQPAAPLISVKLPEQLSNPVDLYINSMNSEGSRKTFESWKEIMPEAIKEEGHGNGTFSVRAGIEIALF